MGCFFSGHRTLPQDNVEAIFKVTREKIIEAVKNRGIRDFYAGGAVGFDMIASMTVLSIKRSMYENINLHIIMPTSLYGSAHWQTVQQIEYYKIILKGAATVETVSPVYHSRVNFMRNQRLTECGHNLGIVYAEPEHDSRGTYITIDMARKNGTEIINIYDFL